jgi:molybdenum cofactor cytidylyltransferase
MNELTLAYRNISCIILAAGQSKRMTQSKIILPWGKTTVIGKIITSFRQAGVGEIVVVTGGYHELVEAEVAKCGGKTIFNAEYTNGSMITSLQKGLGLISPKCRSILVALGDQPDIDPLDIKGIIIKSNEYPEKIIIPSYTMRRGHPWLVPVQFSSELLSIQAPATMKTFLQKHENDCEYYVVQRSNILADLDTPEDYEKLKPKE